MIWAVALLLEVLTVALWWMCIKLSYLRKKEGIGYPIVNIAALLGVALAEGSRLKAVEKFQTGLIFGALGCASVVLCCLCTELIEIEKRGDRQGKER